LIERGIFTLDNLKIKKGMAMENNFVEKILIIMKVYGIMTNQIILEFKFMKNL